MIDRDQFDYLTEQEFECAKLFDDGYLRPEVAKKMSVSVGQITKIRKKLKEKLRNRL